MLKAEHPWLVKPVSFGNWGHPCDKNRAHGIIGSAYDNVTNVLYLALSGAGKIGSYDNPPLIISYKVIAK